MYCRYCGSEIQEGEKFCTKCGKPVEEKPGESTAADTHDSVRKAPKRHHMGLIAAIIVAVAVIAIMIIIVTTCSNRSEIQETEPEQEAESEQTAESELDAETERVESPGTKSTSFADNIIVSDAEISTSSRLTGITLYGSNGTKSQYGSDDDLYYTQETASADITNNNDEPCTVVIGYEYTITTTDSNGDEQVETDTDELTYNIAANEARLVVSDLGRVDPDVSKSYTGKMNEHIQKYDGEDVLLPISSVTDINVSPDGSDTINITFTLPNDTSDNWDTCKVDYQIFIDDVYSGENAGRDSHIKPGETASVEVKMAVNDSRIDFNDLLNKLTVNVAEVSYSVDMESDN